MFEKVGMGMVGGGVDSFIGEVHRMASRLDDKIEILCGSLSSTKERSINSGKELGLKPERTYENFSEMISNEASRQFDKPMEFVSIVTPNHLHFQPAKEALENGFHVMLDKPLTWSLEEAYELRNIVESNGKLLGVTYTYTGYPMVKQAKHLSQSRAIGQIKKVHVDYPQGWLTRDIEKEDQKQASWRVDPAKSGKGGAMGDIGTHAENIIHYVTGLEFEEISANLSASFENRKLDDNASISLRFTNGASGTIRASQVLAGEENGLKLSVYGEEGSIHWSHASPNKLVVKWLDKPEQMLTSGVEKSYLCEHALKNTRLPSGHPEGFIEAFANIYRNFAFAIRQNENTKYPLEIYDFPGVEAGIRGMAFIETAIASSSDNGKWKKFDYSI